MSFAYLPFYTGDYFRDTRGLSMAGHGCYFLLLTYCWDSKGPLPLDEERIAGICEARNQEERTTLSKILRSYFVRMEDGWYQNRMQREIEKAANISLARKSAGAKGYQAKAKHLPSKSQASAKHLHLLNTNTIPTSELELEDLKSKSGRATRSSAPRATRLEPDWRLPQEWEDWAVKVHHLPADKAVRISLAFRDYWIAKPGSRGCKLDWFATWRNWVRKEVGND